MFNVIYKPDAETDLARIFNAYLAAGVNPTALFESVDQNLKYRPLEYGESRAGNRRIVIVEQLIYYYDVVVDDARVEVLAIRTM